MLCEMRWRSHKRVFARVWIRGHQTATTRPRVAATPFCFVLAILFWFCRPFVLFQSAISRCQRCYFSFCSIAGKAHEGFFSSSPSRRQQGQGSRQCPVFQGQREISTSAFLATPAVSETNVDCDVDRVQTIA